LLMLMIERVRPARAYQNRSRSPPLSDMPSTALHRRDHSSRSHIHTHTLSLSTALHRRDRLAGGSMSTTELELTAPPELADRSRRVTTVERAVFKPFLRWSCLWETTGPLHTSSQRPFTLRAWHSRHCFPVAAVQRMNATLAHECIYSYLFCITQGGHGWFRWFYRGVHPWHHLPT
jgi:hypothetical protein